MADGLGRNPRLTVGRYALLDVIASGGMATIHLGRLLGPVGFQRTVAIKRMHENFARDPEFVAMFLDEARIAARIQHPNVVPIIDIVVEQGELLLVMDYKPGESLHKLIRAQGKQGGQTDPRIAVKLIVEMLSGLHAAHELTNDRGERLNVVHRDVSPQNVLVGVDGVAHLIDFGVAKAADRIQSTKDGQLKGKVAYMAPEQIRSGQVDRRTDIYAAAAVLWEVLTGRRLFEEDGPGLIFSVLEGAKEPPSALVPDLPPEMDAIVMKGLAWERDKRFQTAIEMADALEQVYGPATSREVARWMERIVGPALEQRARMVSVAMMDSSSHPDLGAIEKGTPAVEVVAAIARLSSHELPSATPEPLPMRQGTSRCWPATPCSATRTSQWEQALLTRPAHPSHRGMVAASGLRDGERPAPLAQDCLPAPARSLLHTRRAGVRGTDALDLGNRPSPRHACRRYAISALHSGRLLGVSMSRGEASSAVA